MKRRGLLAAVASLFACAGMPVGHATLNPFPLSASDLAAVARAERHVDSISTLRARFTQIANNGSVTSGVFYMSRPGKMRLEYDPPLNDLIVSDGLFIFHWDDELAQQSQQLVDDNLANVLLRERFRLSGDVTVVGVLQSPNGVLEITVADTEEPKAGRITLVFEQAPMRLMRWRVVDAHGLTTRIKLHNVRTGMPLDRDLFVFRKPRNRR